VTATASQLPAANSRERVRTFAASGRSANATVGRLLGRLGAWMRDHGYHELDAPGADTNVVLHPVDADATRPYRRKNAPTFVVAVAPMPETPDDMVKAGYPILVRALANVTMLVVDHGDGRLAVHFVTLEQGTATVGPAPLDDTFVAAVFTRLEPLASSRLVIANEFRDDLAESLRLGDERSAQMLEAGRRLDALGLLPAPFPLEEILPPRDLRHVQLLYGLGGLSYGNCSIRRIEGGAPTDEFWMSASGVDKSSLREIGRDILLVRDYDAERDTMILSVPEGVKPRRVSVDAIEHWMIYREHPDVGAILHVHGWIEDTPSTEINYPCGTLELATAVADLVRVAPEPARTVVGQRNHGLTITGVDLDEIFERVGHRISARVPMS
jgi:ribulose-5-phosphate 4-epimerase/fuculose-1-phosphate aldolase